MPKKIFYRRRRQTKKKPLTRGQRAVVREMIKGVPERKFDHVTGNTGTYSPFVIDLSAISQGDTVNTREGDVVTPISFNMKYRVIRDSGVTAATPDTVRCIIAQWHPDTALSGSPAITDILEDGSAAGFLESPYKLNRNKRSMYTIVYDRTHRNLFERALGRDACSHGWVRAAVHRKIRFNAAATTGSNKLYMFVISQSTSATEDCAFVYDAVLRFTDM